MIKVVSIDDNQDIREGFVEFFKENSNIALTGTAENGMDGYELIKKEMPDVVILDIVMPKLDGLGLLEKLAEEKIDTKIIMYSAIGNDKVVQKTFSLGAQYYVMKPSDMHDIEARIIECCASPVTHSSIIGATSGAQITESNLESVITDIIHDIGVPAHIKGYNYLRDAIGLCIKDDEFISDVGERTEEALDQVIDDMLQRVLD